LQRNNQIKFVEYLVSLFSSHIYLPRHQVYVKRVLRMFGFKRKASLQLQNKDLSHWTLYPMLSRSKIKNDWVVQAMFHASEKYTRSSWKIIWVMQTKIEGYHRYTEVTGWKDVNDLTQDRTQW